MKKLILFLSILALFASSPLFSQEEIEYKKFKLAESSCDVGIRYKKTSDGFIVGVSAIATGKGAEFRHWKASDIKLNIDGKRFRPDKEGKFYVTEESFFRVPGAIVFAALAAYGDYRSVQEGIGRVGVALGLGLIALQAKGEITGERCAFNIPDDMVQKIKEGRDSIDIIIENEGLHLKETIKIGLIIPTTESTAKYNYDKVSQGDLLKLVDTLKEKISSLEQEQTSYKYGRDPEYDDIQRKIEKTETERGMAYKTYLERKQE